jgi:hypothetical protein
VRGDKTGFSEKYFRLRQSENESVETGGTALLNAPV